MKHNKFALLTCAFILSSFFQEPCQATSYLNAYASCSGAGTISFTWYFQDEPDNPTVQPEWTGWDIMRRTSENCGPWIRVNDQPFPRFVGSHEHSFTETPPAQQTTYEYEAISVDENRQPIGISTCSNCVGSNWSSCPQLSAPLTEGTLEDWGWALFVQPCAEKCYGSFYFVGPEVEELRQYAGTGTVVRLYGTAGCGTIEGCAMDVDRYEFGNCEPTPISPTTWSHLKTFYR